MATTSHLSAPFGHLTLLPVLPVTVPFAMSIEHVSRHLIKTVRQKPLVCAAVAATSALVAYLMWAEEEEEEDELACVRSRADVYPGALQSPKSFTVTNERGELRGQVDETASSWSWFVEEEQWALLSSNLSMTPRGTTCLTQTPTPTPTPTPTLSRSLTVAPKSRGGEEPRGVLRPDSKGAAVAEHDSPPRPERRRSKVGFQLVNPDPDNSS